MLYLCPETREMLLEEDQFILNKKAIGNIVPLNFTRRHFDHFLNWGALDPVFLCITHRTRERYPYHRTSFYHPDAAHMTFVQLAPS